MKHWAQPSNGTCAYNLKGFESFAQLSNPYPLQVTAWRLEKEGKHCIYFTQQNKALFSVAVHPVASNITIYIPEEPDNLPQKLHQNRSETALLSIIF